MVDIIGQKVSSRTIQVYGDDDFEALKEYHINQCLKMKVSSVSRIKERAYKELCCYKGSCKFIASHGFNEDMNTLQKVDIMTKIDLNFTDDIIHHARTGRTQWILSSLGYKECNQPRAHDFIKNALENHALLVGIKKTEDYVALLKEQK